MSLVIGLLGVKALYLLIAWMLAAIIAQDISDMKAYGEKPGLATGLLLTFVGVIVWLVWPAREISRWKLQGPIPKRGGEQKTLAELRAEKEGSSSE